MTWTQALRNVLSGGQPGEDGTGGAAARSSIIDLPALAQAIETRPSSFDAIGQRDEALRQRIGVMLDRLDDLKTLQDDFSDIMSPMVRISEELSRASVRTSELEALLGQERQASGLLRQDSTDLALRLTTASNELSGASARAQRAEAALVERDATIEEARVVQRDNLLTIESLERQLFAEVEQNKALIGENKALRVEAQTVDQALARAEHDLLGARERLGVLDQDNRRLQTISEEQGAQLAEHEARRAELEAASEADKQRIRALESHLAAETGARERSEAQAETESAAHRTERAGLAMKLESAENRASSTAQLLIQARNQLREKDEAYRATDRSLKEAIIARATSDRRLDSAQGDHARQTERLVDLQKQKADLDARCDMLAKALAAKDAALDQAVGRNAGLTERIEQISGRHESARAELDAANRRLTEDLQNERAERALMQGALEIARESRVALQKQHEALKRSSRGWRDGPREEPAGPEAEESNNVHPFNSGAKPA